MGVGRYRVVLKGKGYRVAESVAVVAAVVLKDVGSCY
ncbi:hypothetical protein COLO4_09672 [Corchorus olitorius]|uniref:Uncharacterized protein n=1 Tax=Corchorus olitorius TaxID=93759 RepID=A0A1R3KBE8_9ROSI|nr:hypothetical protein COLO4_09672 [Corchorus olitorius]